MAEEEDWSEYIRRFAITMISGQPFGAFTGQFITLLTPDSLVVVKTAVDWGQDKVGGNTDSHVSQRHGLCSAQ